MKWISEWIELVLYTLKKQSDEVQLAKVISVKSFAFIQRKPNQ